jgi:hypothetical protein
VSNRPNRYDRAHAEQAKFLAAAKFALNIGTPSYHGLCDHQGYPDRYQRQQHGDRVAVNHQQDGEHQDGNRKLNQNPIPFSRDSELVARSR